MSGEDLVLVLRYRKAVTYGFHVLLGALGEHETSTRYEVRFGESVLVDASGDPTGIPGLAYRDTTGEVKRTGKAKQRDLDEFPGFALKWDKFNALEITRGCIYACA